MENSTAQVSPQQVNRKVNKTKLAVLIIVLAVLIGLFIYSRSIFVAASVNGNSISRLAVIKELEKQGGKGVLDVLIAEELVKSEVKKQGIKITDDEIQAEIKKLENMFAAQGGSLAEFMTTQKLSMSEVEEKLETQIAIQKMFKDKVTVTDDEVVKYIRDNKITLPKESEAAAKVQIAEQIKGAKLNQEIQTWVSSLRSAAEIKYYRTY